ncbi:S8 family peptidase [Chryseolinea lacunae]|uniref:S8 family serine peptidase n=1 Tax=Chryseolinea lacunae TaxID=2801331 RepID=A0ABS1KNQ9_9BACT|nr:S8 family serine peptidase [Chryseolinea lacunae]MBL0740897.1 S8 family serine peptidase [Chryseolinea lacunae]
MNALKRQVEKILDEASGGNLQLIVTVKNSRPEINRYIQAASESAEKRKAAVNPRSLLPPSRKILIRKSMSDKKLSAELRETNLLSAKTLIASLPLQGMTYQSLKISKPSFLNSAYTAKSIERLSKRNKAISTPPIFHSSRSVLMELSKDELFTLSRENNEISGVFLNRKFKGPPVYKASKIPSVVMEHKGYTWGINKCGALSAWGSFGAYGEGVKIAVLDTGVDPNHQDLKGKISHFAEFDDLGYTVTEGVKNAYDDDVHGTHCAGIIVGGNQSGRWIGVAPKASIMAGIVLKNGYGTDAQILAGIEWAIANKADVISMSLGGTDFEADVFDTYTEAILNANSVGIPVVVAIGNEGHQITGAPGNDFFAFSIGATDVNDGIAGFSGGRTQIISDSKFIRKKDLPLVYQKPDISAPGVDIYSCVPRNKYATLSGTSMATPHVAGAMALLLSKNGQMKGITGLQKVDVLQYLLISAVKQLGECGQNQRYGFGRIDILRALGDAQELGYW